MGSKPSTSITVIPPPTAQEQKLLSLNTQLAEKQLAAFDTLAPFQAQLLETSTKELARQNEESDFLNDLIGPEERANAIASEFERAKKFGPIQDELLELQLEQLRSGGAATDEQKALIKEAADKGIEAGSFDIDASTERGLGLINDSLANSRGLRGTDSPIFAESELLAREGEIQKGSLTKNLRAGEAAATLNFPLAAQQVTSSVNQNQQNILAAASNFKADLNQRAFQNRLALSGQGQQGGLGLTSVSGFGLGALNSLTNSRIAQPSTKGKQGLGFTDFLAGAGSIIGGVGLGFSGFNSFGKK